MPEFRVCIERIRNGFEVTVTDPKIVKQNNTRDKNGYAPYKDPQVEYGFKNVKEVLTFLEANLEKALPAESYSSTFDSAVAAATEGDD